MMMTRNKTLVAFVCATALLSVHAVKLDLKVDQFYELKAEYEQWSTKDLQVPVGTVMKLASNYNPYGASVQLEFWTLRPKEELQPQEKGSEVLSTTVFKSKRLLFSGDADNYFKPYGSSEGFPWCIDKEHDVNEIPQEKDELCEQQRDILDRFEWTKDKTDLVLMPQITENVPDHLLEYARFRKKLQKAKFKVGDYVLATQDSGSKWTGRTFRVNDVGRIVDFKFVDGRPVYVMERKCTLKKDKHGVESFVKINYGKSLATKKIRLIREDRWAKLTRATDQQTNEIKACCSFDEEVIEPTEVHFDWTNLGNLQTERSKRDDNSDEQKPTSPPTIPLNVTCTKEIEADKSERMIDQERWAKQMAVLEEFSKIRERKQRLMKAAAQFCIQLGTKNGRVCLQGKDDGHNDHEIGKRLVEMSALIWSHEKYLKLYEWKREETRGNLDNSSETPIIKEFKKFADAYRHAKKVFPEINFTFSEDLEEWLKRKLTEFNAAGKRRLRRRLLRRIRLQRD